MRKIISDTLISSMMQEIINTRENNSYSMGFKDGLRYALCFILTDDQDDMHKNHCCGECIHFSKWNHDNSELHCRRDYLSVSYDMPACEFFECDKKNKHGLLERTTYG